MFGILELLIILIGLVNFGVMIWGIIDCIRNKVISDTNRIISIILIVCLGMIGVIIYGVFLRNQREESP